MAWASAPWTVSVSESVSACGARGGRRGARGGRRGARGGRRGARGGCAGSRKYLAGDTGIRASDRSGPGAQYTCLRRARERAQGEKTSAHHAECRYSYVREAHENRLSPLLIRLTVCSSWVRRRLGDGWVSILISGEGTSYACSPPPDSGRAAGDRWRSPTRARGPAGWRLSPADRAPAGKPRSRRCSTSPARPAATRA